MKKNHTPTSWNFKELEEISLLQAKQLQEFLKENLHLKSLNAELLKGLKIAYENICSEQGLNVDEDNFIREVIKKAEKSL